MDLLIAILLYLGMISTQQSYTTNGVYSIGAANEGLITATCTDTTAMRSIQDYYMAAGAGVDIVDRTTGN